MGVLGHIILIKRRGVLLSRVVLSFPSMNNPKDVPFNDVIFLG